MSDAQETDDYCAPSQSSVSPPVRIHGDNRPAKRALEGILAECPDAVFIDPLYRPAGARDDQ